MQLNRPHMPVIIRVSMAIWILSFSVAFAGQPPEVTKDGYNHHHVDPLGDYVPPDGVIPDKATAILVAKAILKNVYGKYRVRELQSFTATLKEDIWTIEGVYPAGGDFLGGDPAPVVQLSKSKGCVMRITWRR